MSEKVLCRSLSILELRFFSPDIKMYQMDRKHLQVCSNLKSLLLDGTLTDTNGEFAAGSLDRAANRRKMKRMLVKAAYTTQKFTFEIYSIVKSSAFKEMVVCLIRSAKQDICTDTRAVPWLPYPIILILRLSHPKD